MTYLISEEENVIKESNEPYYDEDRDQLEEKQEEKTGELSEQETTNKTF